jgi:S-adenosylmethionine/arginine decarboxylase-like enzyme
VQDGFTHHSADLSGVPSAALRDAALLSGLLVAAAGAAGLSSTSSPIVRTRGTEGVSAILLLEAEGCHISAHSTPSTGLLLLDVLVPVPREGEKAIDVFVRRLGATAVARTVVTRGAPAR